MVDTEIDSVFQNAVDVQIIEYSLKS